MTFIEFTVQVLENQSDNRIPHERLAAGYTPGA